MMLRGVTRPMLTTLAVALPLTLSAVAVPIAVADAQDFERPGVYLSGGWSRLGEQFGDNLNDELEEALEFDDASLSAGDTDVFSGALGFRLGSRFALELVGEQYEDLPIELSLGGSTVSGDLELRSGLLMGKLFLLTGRLQPYLMAGGGYLRGEADFGEIEETGHAGIGRAGLGVEAYLTEQLAVSVQAAYSRGIGSDFEDLAYFTVGASLMLRL